MIDIQMRERYLCTRFFPKCVLDRLDDNDQDTNENNNKIQIWNKFEAMNDQEYNEQR